MAKINDLLNDKQKAFITERGLAFDWENPTDDDIVGLEHSVGDILMDEGLDEDYRENEIGTMCYSILDLMHLVDD